MAVKEFKATELTDEELGRIAIKLIKNNIRELLSRKIGDLSQKTGIPKESLNGAALLIFREILTDLSE